MTADPSVLDRLLVAIEQLEADHVSAIEDARQYQTVTGPLRSAFTTAVEQFQMQETSSGLADAGGLFARGFHLVIFDQRRTRGALEQDPTIAGLLAGTTLLRAPSDAGLPPGDLYGAIETVLAHHLLPWATTVERHQKQIIATLKREDAGAVPHQSRLVVDLESASAWTCRLELTAPNLHPQATFHVQQRRGMRALMRRKREGKSGAALVQAIFSTTASPPGEAILTAMAPHLVGLEHDDVTATLDPETFKMVLPFLPATPSDVRRGAAAAAAIWDAHFSASL